jgi:DNA-binding XRE family transcriptional regulator
MVAELSKPPTIKQARDDLREIKANRLLSAREMNGLDQLTAAKQIGYTKSTQLCLIECGKREAPDWMMRRASDVYSVSLDYLFGVSEEPERDPATAMLRHVNNAVRANMAAVTDALVCTTVEHVRSLSPMVLMAMDAASHVEALCASVDLMHRRSQEQFEDMPGGATVLRNRDLARATAKDLHREAKKRLNFSETTIRAIEKRTGAQHPLFPELEPLVNGIPQAIGAQRREKNK